jgi:hypothetical protein
MKLRTRLVSAVAATALAAGSVSVAAPAQAAPGDITASFAPTLVLAETSCIDHLVTYNVELPPGTTYWTLDLDKVTPAGVPEYGDLLGTFDSSPTSGTVGFQFCDGFQPTGTWTVTGKLDYRVNNGSLVEGPTVSLGTINVVRKAKTKTTLKVKGKGKKKTATSKVSVSYGEAFEPVAAGGKVIFKKAVRKGKKVKFKKIGTGTTDASGVATAKIKVKRGTQVRAEFQGMGEVLVGSTLPIPPSKSKVRRAG